MRFLFLCLLLALWNGKAVVAQNDTVASFAVADPGPFTFKYCDTNRPDCLAYCPKPRTGGLTLINEFNTKDLFPNLQVNMSEIDLERYRNLQAAYMVEFSKNPMTFEPTIDMPFCSFQEAATSTKLRPRVFPFTRDKRPQRPTFVQPFCVPRKIEVGVFFHIITGNDSTSSEFVSDEVVRRQLSLLNSGFAPLGIQFTLNDVERLSGGDFHTFTHQKFDERRSPTDNALQNQILTQIRKGTFSDLNVYIVERIDDTDCEDGHRTSGYCSFPEDGNIIKDGCFIDIDSLPDVSFRGVGFNDAGDPIRRPGTGKTLVHEVGHWFGLRHVFHSDVSGKTPQCDPPDELVVDTPVYAGPGQFPAQQRRCCAANRESTQFKFCNTDPTVTEHVTNWMSYSGDAGVIDTVHVAFPWTRGQRTTAFTKFFILRQGVQKVTCADGELMFEEPPKTKRDGTLGKREISGLSSELLRQPPQLLESLKALCSKPEDESGGLVLNVETGELEHAKFAWWYKLGIWRWVILGVAGAAVLAAIVLLYCCCCRTKRGRRKGKVYKRVDGKEVDKMDPVRMEPLLLRTRDEVGA